MIALLLGTARMFQSDVLCLALCYSILAVNLLMGSLMLATAYQRAFKDAQTVEPSECPWIKFAQKRHVTGSQRNYAEWLEVQKFFDSLSADDEQ